MAVVHHERGSTAPTNRPPDSADERPHARAIGDGGDTHPDGERDRPAHETEGDVPGDVPGDATGA